MADDGKWLQGRDLNPRPSGYEPDELPDCSTLRYVDSCEGAMAAIPFHPQVHVGHSKVHGQDGFHDEIIPGLDQDGKHAWECFMTRTFD